ncbi:hypothetical protein [Psychrobacillus sp. BM2]|uniref:hypothetical protein n=1 Tax=Psychrobacillus sp. BM2 TaxID=3400421 RepID=UPI003B019A10
MTQLTSYDNFNLHLLFDPEIILATVTINDIEVSQMIISSNNLVMKYPVNPSMLVEGVNVLRIETVDSLGEKDTKVLEINKALSNNGLLVGSTLFVKGKQYEVTDIVGDAITLNRELEHDINTHSFVETSEFEVVPKADVTFYNQMPAYKSMNFVKAIYHDGMIEEEYELENVLGDILHTEITLSRDDETKTISISNIERILIPDEV